MKTQYFWIVTAITVWAIVHLSLLFDYEDVTLWVAVATLLVAAAFIALYSTDVWWTTWFGRSLMLLEISVVMYAVAIVLLRLYGDYPWRNVLLLFATGGTFLALLLRTMVLWAVKSADRPQDSQEPR
jgi:hypothetical protein